MNRVVHFVKSGGTLCYLIGWHTLLPWLLASKLRQTDTILGSRQVRRSPCLWNAHEEASRIDWFCCSLFLTTANWDTSASAQMHNALPKVWYHIIFSMPGGAGFLPPALPHRMDIILPPWEDRIGYMMLHANYSASVLLLVEFSAQVPPNVQPKSPKMSQRVV